MWRDCLWHIFLVLLSWTKCTLTSFCCSLDKPGAPHAKVWHSWFLQLPLSRVWGLALQKLYTAPSGRRDILQLETYWRRRRIGSLRYNPPGGSTTKIKQTKMKANLEEEVGGARPKTNQSSWSRRRRATACWKMSEYAATQRSSLKLKGVGDLSSGKK